MALPYLGESELFSVLPLHAAVDALDQALRAGVDPGADPPRRSVPATDGELLVMPSAAAGGFVVKLVSVAPDNPSRGLPRIQGVAVVFDETHAPVALIDGIALTSLRTPATSALAIRHVAAPDARRLVVFGSGPQAAGHIEAVRLVRPVDNVVVIGRDQAKADRLASATGSRVGSRGDVKTADVVICATTARLPLFDGQLVRDGACVVAVGSHEPAARELDSQLIRRSRLVVEDPATALTEAGELVMSGIEPARLEPLAEVVTAGPRWESGRPTVVKTVGMSWEDAVVARAAVERWL